MRGIFPTNIVGVTCGAVGRWDPAFNVWILTRDVLPIEALHHA